MAEEQNQASQLHQQASAHYLQGEFPQALQSWRELLALDPQDERALEGVRLCELLADDPPPPSAEAPADGMDEVDAALEFQPQTPPAPTAAAAQPPPIVEAGEGFQFDLANLDAKEGSDQPEIPNPERQADGIDFGDVSSVQTIGLAAEPEAVVEAAPAIAGNHHEPTAVTDLARKTTELYAEATAAHQAGDPAQALAVLSRLFVLDETSAQGHALAERIRAEMQPVGVLQTAHEAVPTGAAYQPPPIPGAAPVLDLDGFDLDAASPGGPPELAPPVEAIDSAMPPDPSGNLPNPAGEEALALDLGGLTDVNAELPQAEPAARPAPRRPAPPPVTAGGSSKLPALSGTARYVLLGVIVAGVLGAAGYYVVPALLEGEAQPATTEAAAGEEATTAGQAAEPVAEVEVPEPAAPILPDRPIPELLREAEQAIALERYDEAVLAYHAVLKADPSNSAVREQARVAGDLYKQQQEVAARRQEAREHFENGRYEQAMKIFYRLPEDDPELLERYRFNGWYNMGRESLLGGDCLRARKHFREAGSIRPDDELIASALSLCETCRLSQKPAEYYQATKALEARSLEQ